MARWEVCTIHEKEERQTLMFTYYAIVETPQGPVKIDETKRGSRIMGVEERTKLVGRLLEQGWEPVAFDELGRAKSFKRQVP